MHACTYTQTFTTQNLRDAGRIHRLKHLVHPFHNSSHGLADGPHLQNKNCSFMQLLLDQNQSVPESKHEAFTRVCLSAVGLSLMQNRTKTYQTLACLHLRRAPADQQLLSVTSQPASVQFCPHQAVMVSTPLTRTTFLASWNHLPHDDVASCSQVRAA